MEDIINILCATDNNYAPFCGIMLTSLFESNKDCHFDVYVLIDNDVSTLSRNKFSKLGEKYGNGVNLMTVDNSILKGFPIVEGYVTLPTYYRLLATEMLPDQIHKVVYLDVDIIVKGDIMPLWLVDLEGVAIAGVRNFEQNQCERLGYDSSFGYFNAGVLVYNLDYWREHGVKDRLLEYIRLNRDNKSNLRLMDQDALNVVLREEKMILPERFNYQVQMFAKEFWEGYSEEQKSTFLDEGGFVSVIHYAGTKPWNNRKCFGPLFHEWENVRKKSLWPHCRYSFPLNKQIKYLIKRAFFPGVLRKQLRERWFVAEGLGLFPSLTEVRSM